VWEEYQMPGHAVKAGRRDIDRVDRFSRVEIEGHYEPAHQVLLDNISHAGQPGYEVLTPFVLTDGGRLLVNRGWVPFTGFRDHLPDVTLVDVSVQTVSGRAEELPAAGLASGRAPPEPGANWPKLTSFPTQQELEAALHTPLARRQLLLDPGMANGYVREWTPPGLPPDRHFSYAIQWWGFAVVLLVLYFGLNFRKVKSDE